MQARQTATTTLLHLFSRAWEGKEEPNEKAGYSHRFSAPSSLKSHFSMTAIHCEVSLSSSPSSLHVERTPLSDEHDEDDDDDDEEEEEVYARRRKGG